ncbi:hypothetical protein DV738_g599, partial [Chaetothyriales sp. CBS 135597]
MDHPLYTPILNALLTQHKLPVSPSWLSTFVSTTQQPAPPLVALTSTARFRILVSDIKTCLSQDEHAPSLPADINNVSVKELRLSRDVVVQVLDIVDVGVSKWSQVEAMERVERGEEVRGREVIRTVANLDDGGAGSDGLAAAQGPSTTASATAAARSVGPHKLILQDARGVNVTAFEQVALPQLFIGEGGVSIGCKLLLQAGTLVRRGMVMMTPDKVVVMGGKVESWDRKWRELLKERLVKDVDKQIGNRAGDRSTE